MILFLKTTRLNIYALQILTQQHIKLGPPSPAQNLNLALLAVSLHSGTEDQRLQSPQGHKMLKSVLTISSSEAPLAYIRMSVNEVRHLQPWRTLLTNTIKNSKNC